MRQLASIVACAAVVAALAHPTPAAAQGSLPWLGKLGTLTGAVDIGGRAFTSSLTDQQKGKFEEYKDLPAGFALDQALLKYIPADSFGTYQISGRKLFDKDQSAWLWANHPGLFDFQVRYDNILHTISTDARSLGSMNSQTGYYTIPTTLGTNGLPIRPDSFAWRAAPYLAPVRTQWSPVKMSLAFTPAKAFDTKIDFTHIDKRGEKPMGMAFGGSSNDSREILEPINQTVQDVRVMQSYSSEYFHIIGSYDYNKFDNAFTSVSSENPQSVYDTPAAGAAVGRTALAPSNIARSGSLTGLVNLPFKSRIVATYTRSDFEQNQNFIPTTTNAFIIGQLAPLPETSAHGEARTVVTNFNVTSHPIPNLSLAARVRNFDYSNNTPSVVFAKSTALNDRSVIAAETTEVRPFSKANADFSASYQIWQGLHASIGYATEKWTRDIEVRNVGVTNEKTPRYSLDYTGLWWLSLHASYAKGQKRFDGVYVPATTSENPDARIFDVADRDREKVNVQASLTPFDQFTFTGSWELRHDLYPNSAFGTQSEVSAMVGGDIEWTPTKFVSLTAGYTKDVLTNFGHFRYRTGSVDSLLKNPTWDWLTHNNDQQVTPYAAINATLIPDVLDGGATWSVADGQFQLKAMNPVQPAKGTAAQIASATAFDFPVVTQKMTPVSLFVRYAYNPEWSVTLRYQMEKYEQSDYRVQNPPSPNPIAGAISYNATNIPPGPLYTQIGNYYFLSNYYQNYNAGWVTLMISYRPRLLPFGGSRSTL